MAHMYPYGPELENQAPTTTTTPTPQFSSGDTQEALRFATLLRPYLTQAVKKDKQVLSNVLDTVMTCAAATFPTGSHAAHWFAQVSGRGIGIQDPAMPNGVSVYTSMYCLELALRIHHSLTPATVPADAADYRQEILNVLELLGSKDLERQPAALGDIIFDALHRYYQATPAAVPQGQQPLDIAEQTDLISASFSNRAARRRFLPDIPALAEIRQGLEQHITATILAIPNEYYDTRSFFSAERRTARLNRPEPLTPIEFLESMFRAEFCKVTDIEQQQLRECRPKKGQSYEQWEARFVSLVAICESRPPFQREELCTHYMNMASSFGDELRRHLLAAYATLPRDTRAVNDLYPLAQNFLKDNRQLQRHAAVHHLSTSLASSRLSSPARGRTPHPSSSGSNAQRNRYVTFQANPTQAYNHSSGFVDPDSFSYYASESHSIHTANTAHDGWCELCNKRHATGICWVDQPHLAPADWRPPANELFQHYARRCCEHGLRVQWPAAHSSPPRRASTPTTQQPVTPGGRPILNRAVSPSPRQRQPSPAPTKPSPSYNRVPPPAERPAARYTEAAWPIPDSGFGAMVSDPFDSCSPTSFTFGAHVTTRSQSAVAVSPRSRQQAAPPEPFRHLPPPPVNPSPVNRTAAIRRQPPPVPFAPTPVPASTPSDQLLLPARRQGLAISASVRPVSTVRLADPAAVELPLSQLVKCLGPAGLRLLDFLRLDCPLVVSGVSSEPLAVPLHQVSARIPLADAGALAQAAEQAAPLPAQAAATEHVPGSPSSDSSAVTDITGADSAGDINPMTPTLEPTVRTYDVPSVTYLKGGVPALGITILLGDDAIANPATMIDSGANVNLITTRLADHYGIAYTTSHTINMRTASDRPNPTSGKVTSDIAFTLAAGTPFAVTLRLPVHVVPAAEQQGWDLLLGTGFLGAIGASLDFAASLLHYRPQLPNTPSSVPASHPSLTIHSIPLTTTTASPCPEYLADLQAPSGVSPTVSV